MSHLRVTAILAGGLLIAGCAAQTPEPTLTQAPKSEQPPAPQEVAVVDRLHSVGEDDSSFLLPETPAVALAPVPAPPPQPQAVSLGDYDAYRSVAQTADRWNAQPPRVAAPLAQNVASFAPAEPRPIAYAPPIPYAPQLAYAPQPGTAPRLLNAPPPIQSASPLSMSPVYEEADFGPQAPSQDSSELSAPPPSNGPAVRQTRYDPAIARQVAAAAVNRTRENVTYDGRYVELAYPWGDVPNNIGVCTDLVVRAFRGVGVDLQKLVHEDIAQAFEDYPSRRVYGKSEPDRNIDHRRVVNLERFMERMGASVPVSYTPDAFQPGDVVSWRLNGTQPHIGVVVEERDPKTGFPLVVHNIGSGPKADNILALQRPVGHYRYTPSGPRYAQR